MLWYHVQRVIGITKVLSQSWKVIGRCSHRSLKGEKAFRGQRAAPTLMGNAQGLGSISSPVTKSSDRHSPKKKHTLSILRRPRYSQVSVPFTPHRKFLVEGFLGFKHKNLTEDCCTLFILFISFCLISIQSFDIFLVVFYWSVTTLSLILNSIHSLRRCQLETQSLCLERGNPG